MPAPRWRPTASISSMKMMHGAFFLPCSNKSRTRDAPTPTNISTKSEPLIEKNGTFASPATARASRVLPVPGGPISSTPLGMRPPSFWNFCGSFRNSMISCSSLFASSAPATSRNVTFFCAEEDSFALLLPNDSALLPPLCTWRMKKIQKPMSSRMGAHDNNSAAHGDAVGSLACTTTFFSSRRLTRPSYCAGSVVRNFSLASVWPVSSLPVIVTFATWPASTSEMNSLKLYGSSLRWNRDEKFQTRATRTIIATQKTTLFTVVFNTSSRRLAPQGQDYHAPRERGHPKGVCQDVPGNPHDFSACRCDDGQRVAVVPRDFAVDQNVLHLPAARCTERLQAVAGPAVSDDEMSAKGRCVHGHLLGAPSHHTS